MTKRVGRHHLIAGPHMLRYAQESAFRDDNRRMGNVEQTRRAAALRSGSAPASI